MRKVMVSEEKWNEETNLIGRVNLYEAWFHQFSLDSHEDVPGPWAVAIVERIDNGKVNIVLPGNILFLDEPTE